MKCIISAAMLPYAGCAFVVAALMTFGALYSFAVYGPAPGYRPSITDNFFVGLGTGLNFVEGSHNILIGRNVAPSLVRGDCNLIVRDDVDTAPSARGITVVPGPDRNSIHLALGRALATLPPVEDSIVNLDRKLDRALDAYRRACGGNL